MVVHGPEVIDSGRAIGLINYLKRHGSVTAVLGGTMGRVALIDAGLHDAISIISRKRPSQSILELQKANDVIILLNQAKTRESGLAFGAMVVQAAGLGKPLIQVDYGGKFVAVLRGESEEAELARMLSSDLLLDILIPPSLNSVCTENGNIRRIISAVHPGELISINGTVVGRATESRVEIIGKDGRIVSMKGVKPKQHGLEKLSYVYLEKAIIRSGSIRRSIDAQSAVPGLVGSHICCKACGIGAVFIDHCAEDAFELAQDAELAVTVGDDTTAIAGDILSRLGIPVIGIVDGDLDRLAGKTAMAAGSIIIQVRPGCDDVVGRLVKENIFGEKCRVFHRAEDLVERVKEIAGESLMEIKLF